MQTQSGGLKHKGVKTRDPDATKEALLDAARYEFQRVGYDAASTRTIAANAGCNAALINRYFGSKIGLFEAVMDACIDLSQLEGLSGDEMIDALVEIALAKADPAIGFDPLVAAIRSSGSIEARAAIRDQLGNPMVEELAAFIGGEQCEQRAGVVLSIISGVYVGRTSIGADALSIAGNESLRPILRSALRGALA